MFDFVYRNKRVVQVVLALVIIPFAFVGVDYLFRRAATSSEVATVGRDKITQQEFDDAIRQQQDQYRRMFGRNVDPAMFDNPEIRFSVVENMINERLLQQKAREHHFLANDEQLRRFLNELPAFQEDGKFSQSRYEVLLSNQGMSVPQFERRLRQELSLQPIRDTYLGGAIVSDVVVKRMIQLTEQQREIAQATIDSAQFLPQIRIDEDQLKNYYDSNIGSFQSPEQVRMEYVVLNPEAVMKRAQVNADEVKRHYDANMRDFTQPEQRQASHILIEVKAGADEATKAAAKKKAEELLQQVKKAPTKFAELAQKHSEDPGSAPQGGDLGLISRGMMVKPFEDAVFGMAPNDIVGPVETNFGYHIIKLTGLQPQKVKSFEEAKPQIEQDLQRQATAKILAELAESFQEKVYADASALEPIAKELGLDLKQTGWLSRAQVQMLGMNNPKFVQAVFAPDALQSKRNTEAIEIAPSTFMAARVVEHKAATPRPFEEVKGEIERQLKRRAAGEMAAKVGQEKLALLTSGKEKDAKLNWSKPQQISRQQRAPGLNEAALQQIFRADATRLPAYVGAANDAGGYSVYKILRVIPAKEDDEAKQKSVRTMLSQQLAQEQFTAFLAELKKEADVKIFEKNLEKKER